MNKQRRFAMLVQTGLLLYRPRYLPGRVLEAFDLVLQVPEEAIPNDVANAAAACIDWIFYVVAPPSERLLVMGEVPQPPWISEWLERDNRPNPFA